jgi:broad specificity phosphatase PhoE
MLETLAARQGESYYEFNERVKSLKSRLRAILDEHGFKGGPQVNVLIISHSCVLNFLTAQEFTENGKVKNKDVFDHFVPKKYKSSWFLETN